MLVSIGLYHDRFEVPFLTDSRRFFQEEGQSLMTSGGGNGNIGVSRKLVSDVGIDGGGGLIAGSSSAAVTGAAGLMTVGGN
jgi:hypothetical protein